MNFTEQLIVLDETYLLQMAELYKSAFEQEPWNDNWSDTCQLIDGKLSALSIGTIRHWWEGTNYNIEEFCVAPDIQNKGIGSQFLKMIETDIKKRGLSGIFLQTDNDKPSYQFYRKNGFHELNSHVSFYKHVN